MQNRRYFLMFFIFINYSVAFAQQLPKKSTNINQTDKNNNRIGMWWVEVPESMDHPYYTECGSYENGRKIGGWYKIDEDGNIAAFEHYRNNVLDGEAKYYEKGKLLCIGHFRGLNPNNKYDTITVIDPKSGKQNLVAILSDKGTVKHGIWKYYDTETGALIKEEEYQIDELICQKENMITATDSVNYQNHLKMLNHIKKKKYKPIPSKRIDYNNLKNHVH